MSAWQAYVDKLMASGICKDAAIVGLCENKYVWAAVPGGHFADITPAEIDVLVSSADRTSFFTSGVTIGHEKCSVIRDGLYQDSDWSMDFRTKCATGGPTYNICLNKANTLLIVVKGIEGAHGGPLNALVYDMVKPLRDAGY